MTSGEAMTIQQETKIRLTGPPRVTARNLGACLLALAMALGGCASRPMADPPSGELRQRMDQVVVRVFVEAKPRVDAADTLLVGAEAGAEYAAKNVAKAGAKTGLGIAYVGCHPEWLRGGALWLITCPAGLVAGAAVGVGTAVVGGAGGAVYGAAQAPTRDEIDKAASTLDKALIDLKLANAFREQFISATQTHTGVRIIADHPPDPAMRRRSDERLFPVIVAARIDHFRIIREGRLTPDLSLEISVSADLFDAPEAGRRYTRSWSFLATLGNFYTLTEEGGAGLLREIDAALGTMAVAIVEDIFLSTDPAPIHSGKPAAGTVVTLSAAAIASTQEWFTEQKQKARCGDAVAQNALGEAYAAIEPRVYGWRARAARIDGYHWLRLAEISGHGDSQTASRLAELGKHLGPEEMAEADRRVQEWQAADCGAKRASGHALAR